MYLDTVRCMNTPGFFSAIFPKGKNFCDFCLPWKSVVRLTDSPDMTLDVYCGRKTTIQQQHSPVSNTHQS